VLTKGYGFFHQLNSHVFFNNQSRPCQLPAP
jgi:hypothetical protein